MLNPKIHAYPEYNSPVLPEEVVSVPAMMSLPERHYLYGLASRFYEGRGRIVDAGVFMGSSTVCFGRGVKDNPNKDAILAKWPKPIATFERGQVNPGMWSFFKRHKIDTTKLDGQSFEPILRENTKSVADLVDFHIGDITATSWPQDDPIEILFLDVIKSPAINRFALDTFFPRLIPGHSILIQQDYFIDLLPYLKVTQEYLDEYFEYLAELGPMAVFKLKKEIPAEVLAVDPSALPPQEQLRLIDQSAARSESANRQFLTSLSRIHVVSEHEGPESAAKALDELAGRFPDQLPGKTRFKRLQSAYEDTIKRCCTTA